MGGDLVNFINEPQWVAWRNEKRKGKFTKVPYVAPRLRAEADDSTTWLTHDRAAELAAIIISGSGGGIGIELGSCGEVWLAGIDLDTCRDPCTGLIEPWAMSVLDRLDTYAEVSPSGTGVKAFLLINPRDVEALRVIMGTQHGRQFKR
jgi:putative DNA primase/helicase